MFDKEIQEANIKYFKNKIMEQQKSLVKGSTNLPAFVQDAYETVEKMQEFSKLLLDSKLVPDHLYEKGPDNKPDYTKGKVPAVMMILLQGHQLNLPPLTALQHIIPVNGLLSIKGDAAKTLIFNSGKLQPGTWKEEIEGDISQETYKASITAQRSDTKESLTRFFSVEQAKRAGLWITPKMLTGQDGWKWKKSAWNKFPERMIVYRALGFLARDLFPDVMAGIYTTEEAIDLPQDTETVIETPKGDIIIPDKNFNKERSQNLTSKAADKIDKINKPPQDDTKPPQDEKGQDKAEDHSEVKPAVNENNEEIRVFTKEQLDKMETKDLLSIVEGDKEMNAAKDVLEPVKNTGPKLRRIIELYQEGKLAETVEKIEQQKKAIKAKEETKAPDDSIPMEPIGKEDSEEVNDDMSQGNQGEGMQPNLGFEEEKKSLDQPPSEQLTSNNKGIEVSELLPGDPPKRDFGNVNKLWHELEKQFGIDSKTFETIVQNQLPELMKYKIKEDFLKFATAHEVHLLINTVK